MTQQDEAGQRTRTDGPAFNQDPASQPVAEPSAPSEPAMPSDQSPPSRQPEPPRPSPYLVAGESVPQAYLAPPQPGQPSYGTPPGAGSGRQSFLRPASPQQGTQPRGYGQPGFGQQNGYDQQNGYGRPGYGPRPGAARSQARDPALATGWERLLASTLDWVLLWAVSVALFISPLTRISHEFDAVSSRFTDLNSSAAQAALDAIVRDPANQRALLFWFCTLFGLALVYFWVQHALWGATLGKRALGTRVVSAADRSGIGVRKAGVRAAAFLVGPAALMLLPSPINWIGGALWLADATLTAVDPQRQSLHDRLAGTIVIRKRWLDQQNSRPSPW